MNDACTLEQVIAALDAWRVRKSTVHADSLRYMGASDLEYMKARDWATRELIENLQKFGLDHTKWVYG